MIHKVLEIREHAQAIFGCCSTDFEQVFTCSADGFVVSWNLNSGIQNPFVVKTSYPTYAIECSEETLFVGLNNGDLHWIDIATKREIKYFSQHKSAIFSLKYDSKNKLLISTDSEGYVGIWDVSNAVLAMFFQIPCGKIRSVCFNQNSSEISIGGQNGVVYQFETQFLNQTNEFFAHKEGVSSLSYHPNKQGIILSGGKDAFLRGWDLVNNEKICAFPAHLFAIYGIQFSPDACQFATCSRDKSIKIWDSDTFEIVQKIDYKSGGHQHSVNAIIWTNHGLVSVSDDRRLILWNNSNEINT